MNTVLEAHYEVSSRWELPFDLAYVAEWYVKHDSLYVKFNASDRDFIEFSPDYPASGFDDPYKYPFAVEHWLESEADWL